MKRLEMRAAFAPHYEGPLRLSIRLGAWEQPSDGVELIELIDNLLTLADRGAFVRPEFRPADAAVRVLTTSHAPPGHYVWEFDARLLDARFVQILRNQLVMYTAVFCPVLEASVEMLQPLPGSSTRSALPAPWPPIDELEVEAGRVYPEASRKLRFPILHQPVSDYRRNRRAEIEFVEPISDDTLAILRDWFDGWGRALDCAFAPSEEALFAGKCAIFDAGTDILDEITVETHIEMWEAAECAWNSYQNLVGRIDHELARVAELRIE